MIDNGRIIRSLEKLMLKCTWHDPEVISGGNSLPLTMRDLVEGNFEGSIYDGVPPVKNDFTWPPVQQTKRSKAGIFAGDFRKPPAEVIAGSETDIEDYRGMAPIMSAYFKWLEINEPDVDIYIDHHLENHDEDGWPLLNHFKNKCLEKTGFVFSDLFPQEEYESMCSEDILYDRAIMYIYRTGGYDDYEPLVVFLNALVRWDKFDINDIAGLDFPEAAYEAAKSEDEAKRCLRIFCNILFDGEIELFDAKWQTALKVLRDFACPYICCDDPWEEAYLPVKGPESLEDVFVTGRAVHDMVHAVDPLIDEFNKGPEQFWKKFLRKLNAIAKENPSLAEPNARDAKSKTLVEVLG